jgi:hypothetical protein
MFQVPSSVRYRYFLAILVICLCFGHLEAQVTQPPAVPSLKAFFRALVVHYDPKSVPGSEEVMRAIDQTAGMQPADIADSLPSILVAFRHQDDTVRGYAALAMFAIGERPDGAELLRPNAKAIGSGLDMAKANLQGLTVQLLAMLKPEPGSEVVTALVAFVMRADRNPIAQAEAISLLLRIAPENGDLTPALQSFMARPMSEQVKEALVNGIANSHTENVIAAEGLIRSLEDPSEPVRFQAAQAFQRMPKAVVLGAKPALRRVIDRPDEAREVRMAAEEALRGLDR